MTNIRPFVTIPDWNTDAIKVAAENEFKITSVKAHKLKNGLICVEVDWEGNHLFKYSDLGSFTYRFNAKSVNLTFPDVIYHIEGQVIDFPYEIEIGLTTDPVGVELTEENQIQLNYEAIFHQNTKYGALVYFGPYGWNDEEETFFDSNKVDNEIVKS